ncbi:polysaccharide deacetylase family protein [Paenibacillus terrigena]|uniref:polysaccharide deacetylase family protein n=1 Tax=Paenibacillus terrigena TaxID=369333 RepID=UPI0028D44F82|nr:polysaccharide deacetylase family protein [Paenibacillus terrigena]
MKITMKHLRKLGVTAVAILVIIFLPWHHGPKHPLRGGLVILRPNAVGLGARPIISGKKSNTAVEVPQSAKLFDHKVAVIMYHHIDPMLQNEDTITPELFASQLDELTRNHMQFISLNQFRAFMKGGSVPANAVLVTFDDGYESFYKYAYPIMKKRHISGVCFVITGDLTPRALVFTPHMTPEEIRDMTQHDPNMEVQAHTDDLHFKVDRGHDGLTGFLIVNGKKETKLQYTARINQDIKVCVQKLLPLNRHAIDTFAYPYGLHNGSSIRVLQANGIHYAFTTKSGLSTTAMNLMLLPRINGGSPHITPQALYQSIRNAATPPHTFMGSLLEMLKPA